MTPRAPRSSCMRPIRGLLWVLLLVFYLICTPFVAGELMARLQPYPALRLDRPDPEAQAIVVLDDI